MTLVPLKSWWESWHKYPQSCWLFSCLWLLFLSCFAFLGHLGSTGLVDETEPLFAEAARQMTVTGDWITPYYNGEPRFDKPPLIYWLMAIGYQVIGVNEWAVRLPSALAAIALVIFGFYTFRYFGFATPKDARQVNSQQDIIKRQLWLSAWIGSALMAFNVHTIIWARTGVSDLLLTGCMGTALFCFFWGYVKSEKKVKSWFSFPHPWYLSFYISITLAVLTKGPVGIVVPGLIIFTFLIYTGTFWSVLAEMSLLWGGAIFLVLTIPWYIAVTLANGQAYLNSFFGLHNFQRFTDVVNGHDAPWYFLFSDYPVVICPLVSIFTFSDRSRLRFWQVSFWRQQPRVCPTKFICFMLVWLYFYFFYYFCN